MARKSPGALRVTRAPRPKHARHGSRPARSATEVDGVSRRTQSAISRIEARHLSPGAVGRALRSYRRLLRRPGRYLSLSSGGCPCCDDIEPREDLATALRALPPRAHRELRRLVDPLDEEFLRRTLPDPNASRIPWAADAWWRQRIMEP